jgi:hypothetical protein
MYIYYFYFLFLYYLLHYYYTIVIRLLIADHFMGEINEVEEEKHKENEDKLWHGNDKK